MKSSSGLKVGAILILATLSTACGPEQKQWKPDTARRAYIVSPRQLAPEPVYNRLRWVHSPDVVPSRELPESGAPVIMPVVHLDLKNSTLDEAASALASASRYTSYCSSIIANKRISLNKLGTIDELGKAIEGDAGIRVQIDHHGHAVRFLPKPAPAPVFYTTDSGESASAVVDKEVKENEHQSHN